MRVSAIRCRSLAQDHFGPPRRGQSVPLFRRATQRRRYAVAPAGALLTGLGAGEWSPLRSRPYAHFFILVFCFFFFYWAPPLARSQHPNTEPRIHPYPLKKGPLVRSLGVPRSEPPCSGAREQ